jgi:plastocyanin
MKKYFLLIVLFKCSFSFATKVIISTTGSFTFSPVNANIIQGDTIVFNVGATHTATEVSQSTWNSNGTTPEGIFNLSTGNNQMVVNLSAGTHYYVCQNHIGMGMKGTINVTTASGITNKSNNEKSIVVYPNPNKDFFMIKSDRVTFNRITITDLQGKTIKDILLSNNFENINIADLPSGIYTISAFTKENEIFTEKLVKQ